MNEIEKQLEALLFISGEPLEFSKIAEIIEVDPNQLTEIINNLKNDYILNNRGLTLLIFDNKVQLTTSKDTSTIIEKFLQKTLKEDLTPAALETLAIIAYKGPMTRAEIDNIRGVNSSYIIRNLLIRGLIERDVDPHRANAFIYKISFDFLRKMGLEKIEDMPEYQKFRNL
ncbi:MAG: SMC-Scp complex subunit ScpB [Patescibacteria group bacterium]|nr:SMC-Scp complex subunit ScpB [Patescibacteria group bacterium]